MQHAVRLFVLSVIAAAAATALALLGHRMGANFFDHLGLGDPAAESLTRAVRTAPPGNGDGAWRGLWIWGAVVAAPLFYYLVAWRLYGRDPKSRTVYPQFEPPPGLSPAGMRQVVGMGFDGKAMAAEVLSLAVRGHLRIARDSRGQYVMRRCGAPERDLTPAERRLLSALFRGGSEISASRHDGVRLRVAMEVFRKFLEEELEGPVYVTNVWAVVLGIVVSGSAVLAAVAMYPAIPGDSELPIAAAALLALLAVNILFFRLMKAPTESGRDLLDHIAGFCMFLATAEHERMKTADAPGMTADLYARCLPYALALDLELDWSERFSVALDRALPDPMDYDWYAQTNDAVFEMGLLDIAGSLGVAFHGALKVGDSE